MIKHWLLIILCVSNLSGITLSIQPGWGLTRIPRGLHSTGTVSNLNAGIQIGFNFNEKFGADFGFIYNPRSVPEHLEWAWEGIVINEFYLTYVHKFSIPLRVISPFFTLGVAGEFGLYDFPSSEKTALNLIAGHGYKIPLNNTFSLNPQIFAILLLIPGTSFNGFMVNLGLGLDF